jgi:hypothetical protein
MSDFADGEIFLMQGSAAKPYELKNTGGVYSCSCLAWRNQPVATRQCAAWSRATGPNRFPPARHRRPARKRMVPHAKRISPSGRNAKKRPDKPPARRGTANTHRAAKAAARPSWVGEVAEDSAHSHQGNRKIEPTLINRHLHDVGHFENHRFYKGF